MLREIFLTPWEIRLLIDLDGKTEREIAEEGGVWQTAISQQRSRLARRLAGSGHSIPPLPKQRKCESFTDIQNERLIQVLRDKDLDLDLWDVTSRAEVARLSSRKGRIKYESIAKRGKIGRKRGTPK